MCEPPIEERTRRDGAEGWRARPDEPLRPSLREFADQVAGRCARIGDLYGDWDRKAGDHIRAVMHEMPEPLPDAAKDPSCE